MSCASPKKICIIGAGHWGSVISIIVGKNALKHPYLEDQVILSIHDETIDGKNLSDIINETRENVKYLPGHKLPPNVKVVPDIEAATKTADILVFVIPHEYVVDCCLTLRGKIKCSAVGISLVKGFQSSKVRGIDLISHIITFYLRIPCYVLSGANLATDLAQGQYGETTIGCKDNAWGTLLRNLFHTEYLAVAVVSDQDTVEVCGALRSVAALAAGITDGLGMNDNVKAAVIRLGLMEIIKFIEVFYPGARLLTFFESSGIADLIASCYGGRNKKIAEEFVKTGKPIEELVGALGGQKIGGPYMAEGVNYMLRNRGAEKHFPVFTAVHKICVGEMDPKDFIASIAKHPEHISYRSLSTCPGRLDVER